MNSTEITILIFSLFGCFILLLGLFLFLFYRSIPTPPNLNSDIDISGRRSSTNGYTEFVEEYINKNHESFREKILYVRNNFLEEKAYQIKRIENSHILKFRKKFYLEKIKTMYDLNNVVFAVFSFYRQQTRYRQVNYVKHSYKVNNKVFILEYDYGSIVKTYKKLKAIDFETTTNKYSSNYQRKLMTKELREYIMRRDNYTCRRCGKYMPDRVGLQIDHIIPVSKGGKTVASNLQVLCSNCNAKKSNHY